jgi:hypothetical protein
MFLDLLARDVLPVTDATVVGRGSEIEVNDDDLRGNQL